MHFDNSAERIADSDLEDGELQEVLTSPLHVQIASVKADALVVPERDKCTIEAGKESLRCHSSEGQKASGKPDAWFIFLVLWHERSREEICGKILRTCEYNDSTIKQSRNVMRGSFLKKMSQ